MSKPRVAINLALLTFAALAVHGYHPYAEDAEIYLPGVEKILQPKLFPVDTEFFQSHANLTLFPHLIAWSVRLSHLPFNYALFAWQLASIFLLLLGAWQLTGNLFASERARWGAVALLAALLTMPVAGTALYIVDQYVNPRNLAAFIALFAIAAVLEGKLARAGVWLVVGLAIHPLMGSFPVVLAFLLLVSKRFEREPLAMAAVLPFGDLFVRPTPAYHQAMRFHISHYMLQWQWYEWLGAVAPAVILWWMMHFARQRKLVNLARLCRALVIYNLLYFAAALVISIPKQFEAFARVQPLRSLHLLYMLLILTGGGLIAEHVLKARLWRWLLVFLPLCGGMFYAQRQLFPASAHVEWPWSTSKNPWAQAFIWIRQNTPLDAIVALDPNFMGIPGEDSIGFRALAQRSRLADNHKDSGAVSMFPPLAGQWWKQYQAQVNWKQFGASDFLRLKQEYGVSWVALQQPGLPVLACPYQNGAVTVCRLN
ncbi:MAG TPA: hypothetical protein VF133_14930 [Terriglobales bacterium]